MTRPEDRLLPFLSSALRGNLTIVHRWLAAGADMDLDIIPVVREWTIRKPSIYSLGFFSPLIMQAMQQRQATPPSRTPVDAHRRAKMIAFALKTGQHLPAEKRWLDAYIVKHGPVTL